MRNVRTALLSIEALIMSVTGALVFLTHATLTYYITSNL